MCIQASVHAFQQSPEHPSHVPEQSLQLIVPVNGSQELKIEPATIAPKIGKAVFAAFLKNSRLDKISSLELLFFIVVNSINYHSHPNSDL